MQSKKSAELVSQLATKTIILQAASKRLKQTDDKSLFSLLEDTLEDMIKIQHRLQLEVNQ